MSRPAAYLRKSKSDDPSKEISRDVQEDACRAVAERYGYDPETIAWYIDWDRSADEDKIEQRTDYARLLADIAAGGVSILIAYSQDRLYRSVRTFTDLMRAADKAGVMIATKDGPVNEDKSPDARGFAQIGAVFAELELNRAKARARSVAESRRRRGDTMGALPYGYQRARGEGGRIVLVPDPAEPVAPILEAWERSGRRPRVCARILNDELGIRTKRGSIWDRPSILRLIEREAPDRLPRRAASGRRGESASTAVLAKVLRCWCGRTLTPNLSGGIQSYYCAGGNSNRATHPRVSIAESRIIGWIRDEAARLRVPLDGVEAGEDDGARLDAIEAKRGRVVESYIEGLIDKAERDRRLGDLERERDRVEARQRAYIVPPAIDWSWQPRDINGALRALWRYVQMDEQLRPVSAEWTVPEWRAAE